MRGCKTNGRGWFAETGVSRRATERESRAAGQAGATKPQPVSRCSDGEREAEARPLAMPWTCGMDVGRRRRRQVEAGDGQERGRVGGGRGSNHDGTTMGMGGRDVCGCVRWRRCITALGPWAIPRPSHAQQAAPHRRRMGGFGVRSRGHVVFLASICLPGRGPSAPIAGHRTSWAMPGHPCPRRPGCPQGALGPGPGAARGALGALPSPPAGGHSAECSLPCWDRRSAKIATSSRKLSLESDKRGRHGWCSWRTPDAGSTSGRT